MTDIVLQNAILSFPHLFEAKQYEGQGAFRYSANFILPLDYDFTQLLGLIAQARVEKGLPENHAKSPLSQVQKGPYAGHWMLAAYAYEYAPQVVDQSTAPLLDRTQIWAGCKVHANVDIYGHNKAGGGVTAGLKHVMLVDNSDNMPRLDSRQDASEVFTPIQGAPAATAQPVGGFPAPTGGMPQQTVAPTGVPAAAQPGGYAPPPQQQGFPAPTPAAAPQNYAPAPQQQPAAQPQPGQPQPGGYAPPPQQ